MLNTEVYIDTTLALSVYKKVTAAQRSQVVKAVNHITQRYNQGLGRSLQYALHQMSLAPKVAPYEVQRNLLVPFCAAGNARALMAIEYLQVHPSYTVDRLIELHFAPNTSMRATSFQQLLMGYFHDERTDPREVADLIMNLFAQNVEGLVVDFDDLEKYR